MSMRKHFYGLERAIAYTVWRGPDLLRMKSDDDLSGGSHVLHLALRKGTSMKPVIASRAVYASLLDETQPDGLVRSMYWDSQSVWRGSSPEHPPVRIAAKVVAVPLKSVQQWIAAFEHIQTSIERAAPADDSWPICSLRLEIDPVYMVFEKVWQVGQGSTPGLQRVWQHIWHALGQALQSSPAVTDIEETYASESPGADILDFQLNQPGLDLT